MRVKTPRFSDPKTTHNCVLFIVAQTYSVRSNVLQTKADELHNLGRHKDVCPERTPSASSRLQI